MAAYEERVYAVFVQKKRQLWGLLRLLRRVVIPELLHLDLPGLHLGHAQGRSPGSSPAAPGSLPVCRTAKCP